ncbi:MAG: glycosyltransferase family 9 protein [bacterium]
MKMTISSPDGLGDFILRIPMLRALHDQGHELQLFLREPAASLAAEVFPECEIHVISADPNDESVRKKKNPFSKEHALIRSFQPDLYVVCLFSLSFFDEVWMERENAGIPIAGFTTADVFWPSGTNADPKEVSERFTIKVEVPVSLPELEKNRLLGSKILGIDLPKTTPELRPSSASLDAAREILESHGLKEREYWVACMGGRSGLRMKDWGEMNWKIFLESVLPAADLPVLFLGNPKEWESIERIRSGGIHSVNLAASPPSIPVSQALVALSSGYLGRDSGVMHMAAASRRPVLAAYGGGHWGRFLPSSGPALAVTQSMSCQMCHFYCPYEQPHCITGITMESMLSAWEKLQSVRGVEIMEQSTDPVLETVRGEEALEFSMNRDAELKRSASVARSSGLLQRLFGK